MIACYSRAFAPPRQILRARRMTGLTLRGFGIETHGGVWIPLFGSPTGPLDVGRLRGNDG